MDKATIGGLAMGVAILIISVLIAPGATFGAFLDYPSMAMVFGGAFAATCIAFPIKTLVQIPGIVKKAFMPNHSEIAPIIAQLVEFAELARRDGILSLENKTASVEDPFILLGIQMAVDGTEAELMESILRSEMSAVSQRHKTGKATMDTIGRYAPAFGMIGTLVGLIIMLGNMADPNAIGPGMAVALITTLYGAMVSNMFCLPIADKLAYYSKREMEVREVIVRGLLAIQQGDNPRVLEQKLNTMLSASERKTNKKDAA